MWAKWANANSVWQTVVGDPRTGSPTPTPNPVPVPSPAPTSGESPQGTSLSSTTGQIVDAVGVSWTLMAATPPGTGLGIAKNGVVDALTQQVTLLLYYNHQVYQDTPFGWWFWSGSWIVTTDPRGTSPTPTAVPSPAPPGTIFMALSDYADNDVNTVSANGMNRQFDCLLAFGQLGNPIGVNPNERAGAHPWICSYASFTGGTLAQAAAGNFDGQVAADAVTLRNSGKCIVIRLNHEWSGNWNGFSPYNTSTQGGNIAQNERDFVTAYRRHVAILRAAMPNVLIDWCANGGTNTPGTTFLSNSYPGDDVVDIIGVDIYSYYNGLFVPLLARSDDDNYAGPTWQHNFANRTHGANAPGGQTGGSKYMSWPEWSGNFSDGDSVAASQFITPAIAWMKSLGRQFLYQTYWDLNPSESGSNPIPLTPGSACSAAYCNAFRGTTFGGSFTTKFS